MFHFFKPKISPKKPHELFLGGRKKLSFKLFRWSLSPPFHTKQADKPRWFHDSTGSFFWFAHSGHDPLLVALAYSICRDGNKKKIQKMKLPSHFHGRTEKKKKKKNKAHPDLTKETDFWRIFWGAKNLPTKKSLSGQRRYSTWAPYGGVKGLSGWQWAEGADMLMPKGLEKKWDKFTVTSCWAIAVAKCGEKNVWTYGGTARSMQNSQDNLYGSHHVQVLLKMQQTLSNFGWLLCGFLFWTKQTTKQQNKHCRAVSPKFVIHFWKQFWLLKISTWKVPLSIGGSTPHQHLALMSESKYRGGLTWMR